jgi:DNA-directed RNA polymerase specialized sigma24 family protein
MDDEALRQFFLRPACPAQRQYEALRAVFVEGLSQKEAAQRFGYSYGAFRQLLLEVRSARTAPPFSLARAATELPNKQPLRPR